MQTTLVNTARLAMLLLPLSGCFINGSGRLETKSFDLSDFDSIEIGNSVQLDVARADSFAVSVTADDNLWDAMVVSTQGKTLHIELRDAVYSNITAHAIVSMPVLTGIHASGAAHATFSGFETSKTPTLDLHASGASQIDGAANVDALVVHLSGSSRSTLTGTATTVSLDASGSSTADYTKLETSDADTSLSGSSTGFVTVTHSLDYYVSGASRLVYFGAPQIGRSDSSSGSSVEHR